MEPTESEHLFSTSQPFGNDIFRFGFMILPAQTARTLGGQERSQSTENTFDGRAGFPLDRHDRGKIEPYDILASKRLLSLLFAGCWIGYGATLLLGVLPEYAEPGLVLTRVMYCLCTCLCSAPVWLFCRWLWKRDLTWPRAVATMTAICYPLGCLSTLCANVISNHWQQKPETLSELLHGAFSATSPACALIVWGGLYLGVKQYERNARVEALARTAELRALRHQLTPHFLCNTLNGISTLVGEGQAQEARRMIARLGDFLRTTLDGAGAPEVTLAQEISYLEQYLAIEQARLGERLNVVIDVAPDALDALVPNLLLQPLVENAVQYGVVPYPAGGEITICAKRQQKSIVLNVRNQGRYPAQASCLNKSASSPEGLAGLGLQNTAERLRVGYGAAANMVCRQDDANSWTVSIELPYLASPDGRMATR